MVTFCEFEERQDRNLANYLRSPRKRRWENIRLDISNAISNDNLCEPFRLVGENQVRADRWVGAMRILNGEIYEIVPRVGWEIYYQMLGQVYAVTLGRVEGQAGGAQGRSADLLSIAWFSAQRRGLKHHCGWPKSFMRIDDPKARILRGQLDLQRHLTENLGQEHYIACAYDDLTFNHPLNGATQFVIRHLHNQRLFPFKSTPGTHQGTRAELQRWRENLNLLEVGTPESFPSENMGWNKTKGAFRSSYELGKCLSEGKGLTSGKSPLDSAFFLDSAEVWEMFLLERLKQVVPNGYRVISPRYDQKKKDFLVQYHGKQLGKKIPDYLLLESTGKKIAVLDAKYRTMENDYPDDEVIAQMALYATMIGINENEGQHDSLPCALLYPTVKQAAGIRGINGKWTDYASTGPIGEGILRIQGFPRLSWWPIKLTPDMKQKNWDRLFLESVDEALRKMLNHLLSLKLST